MKLLLSIISVLVCVNLAYGQTTTIEAISIEGNKRTRDKVILRELSFSVGSELEDGSDLAEIEDLGKRKLVHFS